MLWNPHCLTLRVWKLPGSPGPLPTPLLCPAGSAQHPLQCSEAEANIKAVYYQRLRGISSPPTFNALYLFWLAVQATEVQTPVSSPGACFQWIIRSHVYNSAASLSPCERASRPEDLGFSLCVSSPVLICSFLGWGTPSLLQEVFLGIRCVFEKQRLWNVSVSGSVGWFWAMGKSDLQNIPCNTRKIMKPFSFSLKWKTLYCFSTFLWTENLKMKSP